MENLLTWDVWLWAGLIFALRVVNMALETLRSLMMIRGRKGRVWIFGFLQTLIYVLVFTKVIQDLDNIVNLMAYAAGFSTGNVVGMWLEDKMAIGHTQLQVISSRRGAAIAEKLREEGHAVTELSGRGRDGTVAVLSVMVRRKKVPKVCRLVEEVDETAIITGENLSPIRRGFWGMMK